MGVAQGLADKGYIYTDRPAYRAGQLVHVRGVVRRAAGDAYVIDNGKKYTLGGLRRPQPPGAAGEGRS